MLGRPAIWSSHAAWNKKHAGWDQLEKNSSSCRTMHEGSCTARQVFSTMMLEKFYFQLYFDINVLYWQMLSSFENMLSSTRKIENMYNFSSFKDKRLIASTLFDPPVMSETFGPMTRETIDRRFYENLVYIACTTSSGLDVIKNLLIQKLSKDDPNKNFDPQQIFVICSKRSIGSC